MLLLFTNSFTGLVSSILPYMLLSRISTYNLVFSPSVTPKADEGGVWSPMHKAWQWEAQDNF